MLMPSIFGENLFDDDWMDFPFERFDRDFWGKKNPLYGKNAKNMIMLSVHGADNIKPKHLTGIIGGITNQKHPTLTG